MENQLIEHTLPAPEGLLECGRVLEIGPGIRPFNWYKPEFYEAWEPYEVYADMMRKGGYRCKKHPADTLVQLAPGVFEQIICLDVLEHMDKLQGRVVLQNMVRAASKQVVIFTPLGFEEQHGDAWGLGGDYWQEHRSGWIPADFKGWDTEQRYNRGFYAVLTK